VNGSTALRPSLGGRFGLGLRLGGLGQSSLMLRLPAV
jgi:hypothetical protein